MTLGHSKEKDNKVKVKKTLQEFQMYLLVHYEKGFNKVIWQVTYFVNIPMDEGKFDVGKDFYHEELTAFEDIVDEDDEILATQNVNLGFSTSVGNDGGSTSLRLALFCFNVRPLELYVLAIEPFLDRTWYCM
ncbi:hypothetical protein VNO80_30596 [Phaseolus coccineus]|uniref:Uncharacterized protein n=1 Tax=Phaseolus coccineus TaxID=3886 RepID=A0AAN9LGD0_PHACN